MNRQIGGAQQIRKIGLQLRRRTGIVDQNAFFTGRASAHEEANLDGCTLGKKEPNYFGKKERNSWLHKA